MHIPILTINHLFPSNANFDGFFPINEAGFVGLTGRFAVEVLALGTALGARNSGFLWVISDLSTLRSPFVTSSPRFNSANTAATPPPDAGAGAAAGGGGGGGGGGTLPVGADDAEYWPRGTPYAQLDQ